MASTTTEWILELVDRITGPMRAATETAGRMTDTVRETTETVEGLGRQAQEAGSRLEQFGKGMFFLNEAKEGIDTVASSFSDAIDPGVRFQYAMAQVQAISGVSGETLDMISGKARNLAKTFGTDAAEGTRVFSTILSKLGPELAKYPDVMESMAQNAMTLSKTMEGDVQGAAVALASSFNAFVKDIPDPAAAARLMEEQMNIIAKSAQVGAAEVSDMVQSLKNIGPVAMNAGVSFSETSSMLQVMAQRGIYAAEAGTALKNMFTILAAPTPAAAKELQALGVNLDAAADKTLSFADRLKTLIPAMNDDRAMTALFGRENISAGQTLLGNVDRIVEWTKEVQNSNSATEQAAIIMDTYAEKQKRMQSRLDDLKISFFNVTETVAPFISIANSAMSGITTLGMAVFAATNLMNISVVKTSALWVKSLLQMAWTAVASSRLITTSFYGIPIIGWVAAAIGAITGFVAYLYNTSEKFREILYGIGEVIKTAFLEYYAFIWNVVKSIIQIVNPANWFDDSFSFQAVWDNLAKQAVEGGRRIAEAWETGKKKGKESWESRNKSDLELSTGQVNKPEDLKLVRDQNGQSGENGSGSSGGGSRSSVGLGGSGGSGNVRNITMNITMNNSFSVSGDSDVREVAERVKRELIAIFSDVTPVVG